MSAAVLGTAAGARTIPAPGVEHTVGFLEGPAGELFCSIHAPIEGAHAILVMCPPILADHPFSYRRELLLARELARRGVAVWRFHYAGTGHSDGPQPDISFNTMVTDAAFVVEAARLTAALPVTVGGTRVGAMVAAAAAGDDPVVLWEPVMDGSAYLREGFRARMIADGGQLRRKPPTSSELIAELRQAGRIDLLGFSLYEPLYDSINGCRLGEQFKADTGRLLVIDSRAADGAEPSDMQAQELRALGHEVATGRVGIVEGWWFHRTQQSDHGAVALALADVISPWLARCSETAILQLPFQRGRRTAEFIRAGEAEVFALLTPPDGTPRGEAALLLWGGGGMPAFGRNQVATALARRLAGRGYHVLQLDYPGRGDSPGAEPPDPIDEPAKQQLFAAVRAGYSWLRAQGLSRVLTIGSCQGAAAALNTADAASGLIGLAILSPQIGERFEPASDGSARSQVHPRLRVSIEAAIRAGTPLLLVYGVHDEGFESFQAALNGELGMLLRSGGDRFTLTLTQERVHGYMTVSGQEATTEIVMSWTERLAP